MYSPLRLLTSTIGLGCILSSWQIVVPHFAYIHARHAEYPHVCGVISKCRIASRQTEILLILAFFVVAPDRPLHEMLPSQSTYVARLCRFTGGTKCRTVLPHHMSTVLLVPLHMFRSRIYRESL